MIDKNELFTARYRPTIFKNMILPDRIKKALSGGLTANFLFIGPPGTGKTTAAKILIGNQPVLKINGSTNAGIDTLRGKITDFCRQMDMFAEEGSVKVVYLEEFDGATRAFQEGFRAFMEENESKPIRFIATANNINNLTPAIQSRFIPILFGPITEEEREAVFNGYFVRAKAIAERTGIAIEDSVLKSEIIAAFPDFRKVLQKLQYMTLSTDTATIIEEDEDYFKLATSMQPNDVYDFCMRKWGDRPEEGIRQLGRPLHNWVRHNRPNKINVLPVALIKVTEYGSMSCVDPLLPLLSCVWTLQEVFN